MSSDNSQSKSTEEKTKLHCAFCILGPPASGKGTIGSLLIEKYQSDIITPGDIYKKLREEDSEIGDLVRESLKDGGYCPDSLTNQIVFDDACRLKNGFILDGYPRTLVQFEYAIEHYDIGAYLNFDAPFDDLMYSAMHRIQCTSCGKVWSKIWNEADCCDCDNRTWKERFDDSAEMYPKRYAVYQELTSPIIEHVQHLPNYKKFQSLGNPNITAEVLEWVDSLSL